MISLTEKKPNIMSFFYNPIYNLLKRLNLPSDVLYLILTYDGIILDKVLHIKYVEKMFTDLKKLSTYDKYFPGCGKKMDADLLFLIRRGSAKIHWESIKQDEEFSLNNGDVPSTGRYIGLHSKVGSCTRGYQLRKKVTLLKKLGEDSLCDNSISSYGGNSLFSNLNNEFREKYMYTEPDQNDYLTDYIDNKKNKERTLKNSRIRYIMRKLFKFTTFKYDK